MNKCFCGWGIGLALVITLIFIPANVPAQDTVRVVLCIP